MKRLIAGVAMTLFIFAGRFTLAQDADWNPKLSAPILEITPTCCKDISEIDIPEGECIALESQWKELNDYANGEIYILGYAQTLIKNFEAALAASEKKGIINTTEYRRLLPALKKAAFLKQIQTRLDKLEGAYYLESLMILTIPLRSGSSMPHYVFYESFNEHAFWAELEIAEAEKEGCDVVKYKKELQRLKSLRALF